mgnify:CR=1 FL=1
MVSNRDLQRLIAFSDAFLCQIIWLMKTIIAVVAVLSSLCALGQEPPVEKIDSILHSKVEKNHPGIALGIVKDGEIIYEEYRGLSNLQHQVRFDEKTRSNIASTAKQFTALMILHLSIEGKLSLEDDVRTYLTKLYPDVHEKIKIRHLLNHTSGIRDYVELMSLEGQVWWKRFGLDNDEVLALLEKQNDLGFPPGSMKSYSNSNYNLLAKVIEKVTKKSFNDYSKKFFEDLGMMETSFVERYMAVIPNRANPYSDWGRAEWWEVPTVTKTNGEGFLYTTLQDQLIFEQAIQNAKNKNNILLIKSQKPIANSKLKSYGFGLELEDILGRKSVHHSGGTFGFHAQVYRFPEDKLSVFVMSNNGNISSNLIAQEIANILLDPKTKKQQSYDSYYYKLAGNDDNIQVTGQYNHPDHDMLIRIVEKDGKIYWQEGIYVNLQLKSEGYNTYSYLKYPNIKVRFYQDKLIEYYLSGKTIIHKRNTNAPASMSNFNDCQGTYFNGELNIRFDLSLNEKNELRLKFSHRDGSEKVRVFNKNDLLAGESYIINLKRDAYDRIIGVSFSHSRARNIHFVKKTNLE